MLLVLTLACGERSFPVGEPQNTVFLRVDNEDTDAIFVSYRVWDESFNLVSDVLIDLREENAFPRVLSFFPADLEDTEVQYRGGLVEFETWNADLCPRSRTRFAFRYGVTEVRNTLVIPEVTGLPECRAYFIDGNSEEASDENPCTQLRPCRQVEPAIELADERDERFVIHLAGGGVYEPIAILSRGPSPTCEGVSCRRDRLLSDGPFHNMIRAWPGQSLALGMPLIQSGVGCPCGVGESCGPRRNGNGEIVGVACNNNDQCIGGRCGRPSSLALCCNLNGLEESSGGCCPNTFGASFIEFDGLHLDGGKWTVEIHGGHHVTVRHCRIEDGGGAQGPSGTALPTGGMRIFANRDILVEHNVVLNSRDTGLNSPVPAAGILVDGPRRQEGETQVELIANRILNSERAGIFVRYPSGGVVMDGNAVCRTNVVDSSDSTGGFGVELSEGDEAVTIRHGFLGLNGNVDLIRRPEYDGELTIENLTAISPSGSTQRISRVESSFLRGDDVDGNSQINPDPPPDAFGCLPGNADPSFGVCDRFPFCTSR